MAYGVKFRVWGDYACFSRPELKVERVSYDIITPSAARGILDSIYWKPAIFWKIDKLHVINSIEFTNIRRNEVADTASLSKVKKIMKNPEPYHIISTDVRHQRAALVLRNVEYVIEAHFDLTDKAGELDTVEKHYNIVLRRLRKGQFFSKPFLGTREFPCDFEIIENNDIPKSQLIGERDLGYMLYDMGYHIDNQKQWVEPAFFRAVLNNGTLDLTSVEVVQ
ncbi:MAG: type I-C CRISPR-associated protein Cas5c [Lachnospiraceae bacterium]|nr:type I-C CRISPR-associated protein Cas5c [Lachnospiraceae bacterium]